MSTSETKVADQAVKVLRRMYPEMHVDVKTRRIPAIGKIIYGAIIRECMSSPAAIIVEFDRANHPRKVSEAVAKGIGSLLAYKPYYHRNVKKAQRPRKCKVPKSKMEDILKTIEDVCGSHMYSPTISAFRNAYSTGIGNQVRVEAAFPHLALENVAPFKRDVGELFIASDFVKSLRVYIETTDASQVRMEADLLEAVNSLDVGIREHIVNTGTEEIGANVVLQGIEANFDGKMETFLTQMLHRYMGITTIDSRFPTGYRLHRDNLPGKGDEGGLCNVNACQSPIDVTHYNNGTSKHYCRFCADDIDEANYRNNLFERRPGGYNFD